MLGKWLGAAGAAVAMTALASCVSVDVDAPLRRESKIIDRKGAETVSAEIKMGAGELVVRGGASRLVEADFRVQGPLPRLDYEVRGTRGELLVETSGSARLRNVGENRWELRFEDGVPLDLSVRLGAGESRLDLSTLALRRVEVHIGAGELRLDLTGYYKKDVDVEVHGGVGQATILLPRKVGAIVDAKGGIGHINARGLRRQGGAYVNAAYSEAVRQMQVRVRGGVGQIDLVGDE